RDTNAPTSLGANLEKGTTGLVVLLIRGDLLQRYPRATIYARRGRWQRSRGVIVFADGRALREPVPLANAAAWDDDTRFPSFRGQALADVTFLGFPLPKEEVHGLDADKATATATDDEAGWYFVFEEQPTEPRFSSDGVTLPASAD